MGLFNFISGKKTPLLKDFSSIGIDMHSHLIPGIDDGAKTLEESVALVKKLKEYGYRKIITTPHIMSDYYRNTPEIINEGLEKVNKELVREGIDIELEAAAEYYADFEFLEKISSDNLLTMGDRYLLFELSYFSPPESVEEIVFKIQTNGYKPLLAHPERYVYWHNRFNMYEKLKDRGVFFQLNINSLCGHYSPQVKKIAERMIQQDMIDFI